MLHVKVQGDQWKKIYQCSIRHTQPRGFFPRFLFHLQIYFSRSSYGIGKQEKGARKGGRRGRWYETRGYLYYFFVPPIPGAVGRRGWYSWFAFLGLDRGNWGLVRKYWALSRTWLVSTCVILCEGSWNGSSVAGWLAHDMLIVQGGGDKGIVTLLSSKEAVLEK